MAPKGTEIYDLIQPDFYEVAADIVEDKYTHYWFNGGRGSCKSSFVSIAIVLGIISNPNVHAVCIRKNGCDLRDSVYNQILWAINALGRQQLFSCTVSPMAITYLPTGQKIIFKGLDDPTKRKSQKMPFGYVGYVWFEELAEFDGMEEIRSVIQSYNRGGSTFTNFYSYNPPQTISNWVNFEATKTRPDRCVHKSNYLSVPREWLGENFFIEAEYLKQSNLRAYEHEYMGIITGTGGTIFQNIEARHITNEEIRNFCNRRKGIDWGFSVDPFAYVDSHYATAQKIVYIFDELYGTEKLNDEVMSELRKRNVERQRIIADCEESKSITEFQRAGFNMIKCNKPQGSVAYGIKWLQRLAKIVIDSERCPNTYKELTLYEYEKNKNGEFKSDYPDKNNHAIDALRYSYEYDMEKRGMF